MMREYLLAEDRHKILGKFQVGDLVHCSVPATHVDAEYLSEFRVGKIIWKGPDNSGLVIQYDNFKLSAGMWSALKWNLKKLTKKERELYIKATSIPQKDRNLIARDIYLMLDDINMELSSIVADAIRKIIPMKKARTMAEKVIMEKSGLQGYVRQATGITGKLTRYELLFICQAIATGYICAKEHSGYPMISAELVNVTRNFDRLNGEDLKPCKLESKSTTKRKKSDSFELFFGEEDSYVAE